MTRFLRNQPRIDEPAVVVVLPDGQGRTTATLRDLSVSGAAIEVAATLPVGALLDLELYETDALQAEPLVVRARVVRHLPPPGSGLGLEFVGQGGPGGVFRLLDFVERHGRGRAPMPQLSSGDEPPPSVAAPGPGSSLDALHVARAAAREAAARADMLAARVRQLEAELAATRRALELHEQPSAPAARAEPREVTLGPDVVRSLEDFGGRLRRGARLRPTERFSTLQPVTRVDHQLADWLRAADRLDDLAEAARQFGGVEYLTAALYRFFEIGLVRITR